MLPEAVFRLYLFFAEIYGFYGKWYLARSYLQRLRHSDILNTDHLHRLEALINLGIVEKELGRFGRALQVIEEALAISVAEGYTRQAYHCRLHLGHIYLLVHGVMRSREYLMETYRWASENQEQELLFAASCFLSSYELYQQRPPKAAKYLQVAESIVRSNDNLIDQLNYAYYHVMYLLETGELSEAEATVRQWLKETQGIVKYTIIAHWLLGKILTQKGKWNAAETELTTALQGAQRCRLVFQEFQILIDLMRLFEAQGNEPKTQHYSAQAHHAFTSFLHAVEDTILQRQIEESREYETLRKLSSK